MRQFKGRRIVLSESHSNLSAQLLFRVVLISTRYATRHFPRADDFTFWDER